MLEQLKDRRANYAREREQHIAHANVTAGAIQALDDVIATIPAPAPPAARFTPEAIARVCHELNRAYCASQGDLSQPAWDQAPDWQRSSAIKGVMFALANPEAKPADSHESWLAEKQADGWRYGKTKNPERKTHPCFVPYDKLPPAQKAKDYIFLATVRELASA